MSATLFFRLLAQDDKAAALEEAIGAVREGRSAEAIVYQVDPASFRMVPGSPFAYWVSDALRRKFQELPPFEGEGRTVRVGLQTGDDFRFVRAWWEVPPERILDGLNGPYRGEIAEFQAWCRRRTFEGKRWVPFAKGGEYSPYYADIHLVVNWERDGAEIRNFVDEETGRPYSRPQNTDYYFRPGLTHADRSENEFASGVLPAGSIISVKGSGIFAASSVTAYAMLPVLNSTAFRSYINIIVGRHSMARAYQAGVIGRVPWPRDCETVTDTLRSGFASLYNARRAPYAEREASRIFQLPSALTAPRTGLASAASQGRQRAAEADRRRVETERRIDALVLDLYGIAGNDRRGIQESSSMGGDPASPDSVPNGWARGSEDFAGLDNQVRAEGAADLVAALLSYVSGSGLGRWDIRYATGQRPPPEQPDPFDPLPVCSPGMLVGDDGLPARAAPPDYPLRISWDGILVDDADHPEDVVRRVREVLALLWPGGDGSEAEAIEREACEILGVKDLREYFRKPALFFAEHLKTYSKSRRQAPIYWPLSTASGSYTLWIYYHRLTSDTLYTAVNRFVEPKLGAVQRELSDLEARLGRTSGREASRLREQIENRRRFLDELRDLRDEILRVAALPYKPDLNDGVIVNAAPLHRLFRLPRWAQATRECWEKLQRGDYDWAHLADTIWPERVREKCRTDRSLAIAHGLEELYAEPTTTSRAKRGRGTMPLGDDTAEDED